MQKSSQAKDGRPYVKLSTLITLVSLALLLLCPAGLRAKPMSSAQAKKAVRGWLKLDPNPLKTPLGNQVSQVDVFADDSGEPIYYVVYLEPSGFAVVPADDLVEPVIAFADDGIFDPSPDNPLGALVSRDLPGRVVAARTFQAAAGGSQQKRVPTGRQVALEKACFKAQSKWAELNDYSDMVGVLGVPSISDVWVAPIVQSEWGQTDVCYEGWHCYNYFTDNHWPCGCVATATAQLMRFHEYPGTYVWSNLVLRPWDICGSLTEFQRQAIGQLCYDVAEAVDTTYGEDGSWAYLSDAKDALLTTFSYSNAIHRNNQPDNIPEAGLNGMINPNLDANHPVILGVYLFGTLYGHAILADGYGYDTSTLYHHLNLGWDGVDDAWYNLPNVNCSWPGPYDTVDACIYNIFTSGSGEIISGRVTDNTSGDPISDAVVTADRIGGGTYNTSTNANGIYALAKIPSASTYDISVTKAGYAFTDQMVSTGTSTGTSNIPGNKWGIDFVGTVTGPSPPTAEPDTISAIQGIAKAIDLQASDDGLPNPPGVLTYIITSLPSHGTLDDPCAGVINSVPYILADNGNQVVYTPCIIYIGSDSFDFKANDGGTPPDGGDSDIATITINVQSPAPTVIYETNFDGGLPGGWTIIDGFSDGYTWTTTNAYIPWTGTFMVVGYEWDPMDMDEQLITHNIDCSDLVDVTLSFKHVFYHWSEEVADVDVRVDGGSWQNVASYESSTPDQGESVELDISSIADDQPNVQIRWHYYDADWEYYWGIDDVNVTASAVPEPFRGDFEPDCDVDFYDFAVFASAWLSSPGSGNWNPACDISDPSDDFVDEWDLDAFAENWLIGVE